jgi:hypothetical protein
MESVQIHHDPVIGHIFGHFVKVNKDKRDEPENCIINNKINWNAIDKQINLLKL